VAGGTLVVAGAIRWGVVARKRARTDTATLGVEAGGITVRF
jgi:hypothetical protein